MYNGLFYKLEPRSLEALATSPIGGRTFNDVVRGRFETLNEATGDRTRFGSLTAPAVSSRKCTIHIVYQPWWFRVELFLAS